MPLLCNASRSGNLVSASRINSELDLIWGTPAIADAINRNPRVTHHLLKNGRLHGAKKVGSRWVVSRQALKRNFDPSCQEGERAHA
jgi:hypothetical protein